jgi:hypothetical protein
MNNNFQSKSDFLHSKSTENLDASSIKFRRPNALFTGPNSLYHQRLRQYDYPREIGIGNASALRSLDADYIYRYNNKA